MITLRTLALAAALTVGAAAHAHAQAPAPQDTTKKQEGHAGHGNHAGHGAQAAQPSRPRRPDRNLITQEELEGVQATDAMQLVQRLRPQWLRPRGTTTTTQTFRVYRDGMPVGSGANGLRSIPMGQIRSLRFYDSSAAMQRFGPDNDGGVIEVLTR